MPRLLLKCDGVLAEHFCPLDAPPPYQAPDRWDAPHVQHRFAEAIETRVRLPLGKLRADHVDRNDSVEQWLP